MKCPHRIQSLPRRQSSVRCIPSQGSNGWGRSYTPMNQLSQPETSTRLISSHIVTRSSGSVPHTQRMGLGNPLGLERGTLRLVSGCCGYDSCISSWLACNTSCTSSQRPRSWFSGLGPLSRILASAKSTLCTAGIKYPGQWFAIDEARSTRRPTAFEHGQPPFRHYLSQWRTQVGASQH